jgi:hypothetical protein
MAVRARIRLLKQRNSCAHNLIFGDKPEVFRIIRILTYAFHKIVILGDNAVVCHTIDGNAFHGFHLCGPYVCAVTKIPGSLGGKFLPGGTAHDFNEFAWGTMRDEFFVNADRENRYIAIFEVAGCSGFKIEKVVSYTVGI